MEDSFNTLGKPAEGLFRDKGSRFLAFGYPVKTVEDTREIIAFLRKKYHDARHCCFAYRLGPVNPAYRVNDDGEPSGTAGKPIYGQLLAHDLTDTLVVVVRYFGGTLLGKGGLINAYRSATADMLSRATILTRHVETRILITFPYEKLSAIMKVLKEEHLVPSEPLYDTMSSMRLTVREKNLAALSERVVKVGGCVQISDPITN